MKKALLTIILIAIVLAPAAAFGFKSAGIEIDGNMSSFALKGVATISIVDRFELLAGIGFQLGWKEPVAFVGSQFRICDFGQVAGNNAFHTYIGFEAQTERDADNTTSTGSYFYYKFFVFPYAKLAFDIPSLPLSASFSFGYAFGVEKKSDNTNYSDSLNNFYACLGVQYNF